MNVEIPEKWNQFVEYTKENEHATTHNLRCVEICRDPQQNPEEEEGSMKNRESLYNGKGLYQ